MCFTGMQLIKIVSPYTFLLDLSYLSMEILEERILKLT